MRPSGEGGMCRRCRFMSDSPSTNLVVAHLRLVLSRSAYGILIWPKTNIQARAHSGSRPEPHIQSQIHGGRCVRASSSIWGNGLLVVSDDQDAKSFSISGTTSGMFASWIRLKVV